MPIANSCFISYRHPNFDKGRTYVQAIVNSLREELDFYLDKKVCLDTERLRGAEFYQERLAMELFRSACMVVIYTPTYFSTDHPFCGREYYSMLELERDRLKLLPKQDRDEGLIIPLAIRGHQDMLQQIRVAEKIFLKDYSASSRDRLGKNFEPYTSERGITVGGQFEDDIRAVANHIRGRCVAFDKLCARGQNPFARPERFRLKDPKQIRRWLAKVESASIATTNLPNRKVA